MNPACLSALLLSLAAPLALDAAAVPTARDPRSEIEWQLREIARDVAEMAVYAKTGGRGGTGFRVQLLSTPEADLFSIEVKTAAEAPAIVEPITIPDLVAAPEPYVALARKLLAQLKLEGKGRETSDAAAFLDRLSDFRAEHLAEENVRISAWLAREPLNPEAHEEAAFVSAALALKEASWQFWDPRPANMRAAAHLAMASALRPPAGAASITGVFARELLRVMAGDPAGARTAMRARSAEDAPAVNAWANAIELQATGNWRLLEKPITATLLERILHYRALASRISGADARSFLRKRNTEPVADWARTGLTVNKDVPTGNFFQDKALPLELREIASVARLERGITIANDKPNPKLSAVLAAEPTLGVETYEGKARLRPIPWSHWSRYFQRHLMSVAAHIHEHVAKSLGDREGAKRLRVALEPMFDGLELQPLVQRCWLQQADLERKPGTEARSVWVREPAGMASVREFREKHPEPVTPFQWASIGDPPDYVPPQEARTEKEWFGRVADHALDCMRSTFSSSCGVTEAQMETLAARMPYDADVLSRIARQRLKGKAQTLADFDAVYAPLLDISLDVMRRRARLLQKDFDAYLGQLQKIATVRACSWDDVAGALFSRGDEPAVAAAYTRFATDCEDAVAIASDIRWLVDYHRTSGDPAEAGRLARFAGDVGSAAGFVAMADYLEARGDIAGAEAQHKKSKERYGTTGTSAHAFYARRHRADPKSYAAEAAEGEKAIFPNGLEPVTLADFGGPPADGVRPTVALWPEAWKLDDRAVIGAIDGYRIHDYVQYYYVRGLTLSDTVRLIVWDGESWREVGGTFRQKRFCNDLDSYTAPRPEPQRVKRAGPRSEIEWQLQEVVRDLAEMAVYAKARALPEAGFEVEVVVPPDAERLAVRVRTSASAAPIEEALSLPDVVAAPEPYVELTRRLLKESALRREGAGAADPTLLERMTAFAIESVSDENVRVSAWLDREPLNPAAHDEAAFLAALLSVREQAGPFWDPREANLRAAAHLAMAAALRPVEEKPSATAFFARELLRVMAGDPAGARAAVRARRSTTTSAAEKAWANVIELEASGDWRVLETPEAASLVERVMYFRALANNVGDTAALRFLATHKPEVISDWGRAAFAASASLTSGRYFAARAMRREEVELRGVALRERGLRSPLAAPLVSTLKADPSRSVETFGGKARLRALPWSLWSRYFQRHLMHVAMSCYRHSGAVGRTEEAKGMRLALEASLEGLELRPLLQSHLLEYMAAEQPRGTDTRSAWERDREGMFAVRRFIQSRPELAPDTIWNRYDHPPEFTRPAEDRTHHEWFGIGEVPLDATLSIFGHQVWLSDAQLARARTRMPERKGIFRQIVHKRGDKPMTLADFDEIYKPVLEFRRDAVERRAALLIGDDTLYRQELEKLAGIDPCLWTMVADAASARGTEDEVAKALSALERSCGDPVTVASNVGWLIRYHRDKGEPAEADRLARFALQASSISGLEGVAEDLEAMGNAPGADAVYLKIKDRFAQSPIVAAFYARRHRADPSKYAAEAAEGEKRFYPDGLERVELADFKAAPVDGAIPRRAYWPAGWALDARAVIGAIDGYRVRNSQQYAYAHRLTTTREVRLIVWDGGGWREVAGEFRQRKFSGPIDTYTPPKPAERK